MKKIIISLLFAAAIVLNTCVFAAVSGQHSDWAEETLAAADAAGILLEEFADGDLTENITRLDFCKLSYKMLEKKTGISQGETAVSFTDTADSDVLILASNGLINGKSETEFAPNDEFTREEAATILWRIARFMGVKENITLFESEFSDIDAVSDWAKNSVRKMDSLSVMKGGGEVDDWTFSPKDGYTKEQSAATIMRLYNLDTDDYAENVEETKVTDRISLFYDTNEVWMKNGGKEILRQGKADETQQGPYKFVFFQKGDEWYFASGFTSIFFVNKFYDNRDVNELRSAETGEIFLTIDGSYVDLLNVHEPYQRVYMEDDYYIYAYQSQGRNYCYRVIRVYDYNQNFLYNNAYMYFQGSDPEVETACEQYPFSIPTEGITSLEALNYEYPASLIYNSKLISFEFDL